MADRFINISREQSEKSSSSSSSSETFFFTFSRCSVCPSFSLSLSLSMISQSSQTLDKFSVLFVRRFWAPFFEQVVFAIGVLVVTSESDVSPVVKRRFRLVD